MPQSDWSVVWLAVGAISLALMALLQFGAVVSALMAMKEAMKTVRGVQTQMQPLIDRGQALITQAHGVVTQAEGVVSSAGVQVQRVEQAVTVLSGGATEIRQGIRRTSAQVNGTLEGVRTFWEVLRGRSRGRGRRGEDPPTPDFTEWETGGS